MYEYNAQVLRVVDGDTVDVLIDCGFSTFRKERVRLYGINAPESRTRDKEEKKKGLAAKERLDQLITNTDGVIWDEDKKKNFNNMLVAEGHAIKYEGGKR